MKSAACSCFAIGLGGGLHFMSTPLANDAVEMCNSILERFASFHWSVLLTWPNPPLPLAVTVAFHKTNRSQVNKQTRRGPSATRPRPPPSPPPPPLLPPPPPPPCHAVRRESSVLLHNICLCVCVCRDSWASMEATVRCRRLFKQATSQRYNTTKQLTTKAA